MKYGLIVNLDTHNLGDDIQSYSMERFLPRLDYLVSREHIDSFYTETGEKVAAFLGGWYMHKPLNWPPSPFLKLLPISFHITTGEGKRNLTLMDYGARWFKKFPKVGCRDKGTMKELRSLGVTAYLSGCFTLTIKPFKDVTPHGKIVLADLSSEVIQFIRRRSLRDTVVVSHDNTKPLLPPEVVEYARGHAKESDIIVSHYPIVKDKAYHGSRYRGNWNFRHALVEGLLRFYQGAALVVTSRLHAALPCLALGVPVLFIKENSGLIDYRIATYLPYFNYTTPEKLLARSYPFEFDDPPANPGGHERFSGLIRRSCKEFITSCREDEDKSKVDVELWFDAQRKGLRLKQMFKMFVPGAKELAPKFKNEKLYRF